MPTREQIAAIAADIQRQFAEEGRALEGGFFAYCAVRQITNQAARDKARDAFYAGCDALFTTMTLMLDPGSQPTDADMARIHKVWLEIEAWREDRALEFAKPGGTA